jgi:hypothetical protein
VPIARLHPVRQTEQQRKDKAYNAIIKMINTEIKPMFEQLLQEDFGEELKRHINVDSFSTEGDVIHQLVDCVVLGPFSAAELNSNVHPPNMPTLPVPQYHRGSPLSRDFTSWGITGGSDVRKKLISQVLAHVDEHVRSILVQRVKKHVSFLADMMLDKQNFLCLCNGRSASIDCCTYSNRQDIVLKLASTQEQTWDMSNNMIADTFTHVSEAGILETLWINKIGDAVPLTSEQISQTTTAHLFSTSKTIPVHTYDIDNSLTLLNNVSLWEWCTGRITGLYATMPLTSAKMNENEGRAADASIPHVASSDYDYNPDIDTDTAPSRDHHEARKHSMELLVAREIFIIINSGGCGRCFSRTCRFQRTCQAKYHFSSVTAESNFAAS